MHIIVTMLPVGQGAMNLIETYEQTGPWGGEQLCNLTLIDCGFQSTRPMTFDKLKDNNKNAVLYMADKMQERSKVRDGLLIDNIIFTHRDTDHWILFDNLWEAFWGEHWENGCAIVREKDGNILGNAIYEPDNNTKVSYFMDQIQKIAEHEVSFCTDYIPGNPFIKIRGKHSFQEEDEETELIFNSFFYDIEVKAVWTRDSMDISIYTTTEDQTLLVHVMLGEEQGNAVLAGNIGEYFFWNSGEPVPQDDSQMRALLMAFMDQCKCYFSELEGIDLLGFFLEEKFPYMDSQNIIDIIIKYGQNTSGVIGNVYVGGNAGRDRTKTGRLSGVGLMLKRAELLSAGGVHELAAGMEIPLINQSVSLFVVERLGLEELSQINGDWESSSNSAIQNNGTSAVLVLLNKKDNVFQKFFFPGDATVHTFYSICFSEEEKVSAISNAVWTAPHHGSYTTNRGTVSIEDKQVNIFQHFLSEADPKAVIISAGYKSSHGHPNFSFIKWLCKYFSEANKEEQSHNVCFNFRDDRMGQWCHVDTIYPIYTSLQHMGDTITYQAHNFSMSDSCHSCSYSNTQYSEWFDKDYTAYSDQQWAENGVVFTQRQMPPVNEIPSRGLFLHRK